MRKFLLYLQRFAEGSDGAGDSTQAAAGTGEATEQAAAAETRASFEDLIKGEYKEDYDKAVQKIVRQRFSKAKANEEKLGKIAPIMSALAAKYGCDAEDIDGIAQFVSDDDELYEEAAYKAGLTVDQYKRISVIEAENQRLRAERERNEQRRAANEWYEQKLQEAEQLKAEFPDFNLDEMMKDERFVNLIHPQNPYAVPIREAYLAMSMDKILPGAMEQTAKAVAKKTADTIRQRGARPLEGGMSGQASLKAHTDVSKLTDAEIADYVRRANRGERITF